MSTRCCCGPIERQLLAMVRLLLALLIVTMTVLLGLALHIAVEDRG